MKIKKIYVVSPYTSLESLGYPAVRYAALCAMQKANFFYSTKKIELYSPVLNLMHKCEKLNYEEIMQICFKKLKCCDEIFICESFSRQSLLNSKGIKLEYEFAKSNGIKISFSDKETKRIFKDNLCKN